MAIPQRSFYHGAVLAEITESEHFTSINKIPNITSSSAYQLNHNTGIFIKYTTTSYGGSWRFTFQPEHQNVIKRMFDIYGERTFIIFVCEDEGFCIVDYDIFANCIDLNHTENEWIEIYRPEGGSFRIRGARAEHSRVIPLNLFPRRLFE